MTFVKCILPKLNEGRVNRITWNLVFKSGSLDLLRSRGGHTVIGCKRGNDLIVFIQNLDPQIAFWRVQIGEEMFAFEPFADFTCPPDSDDRMSWQSQFFLSAIGTSRTEHCAI